MKTRPLSLVAGAARLAGALMLSGCSANFGDASNTSTATAMHLQGVVHGGQQSLNGAHVYMYAPSTTGYGGAGIAASSSNASQSLLTASAGVTTSDGTNYYVTTDAAGNFNIDGAFACTPGTQVYLYSSGGDPQLNGFSSTSNPNAAATLLAVLGPCASATPSAAFPNVTFVTINEVSTIAAAYALAGFATDPLHIGAPSSVSGHSLSATGITNAFSTAVNIVDQASGLPNTSLPQNSNATVPATTINTLADILAACVNTTGTSSSGCSTLFSNTTYSTAPTDTATAAINIAQHPGANVSALINLATSTGPFQGTVSSANDFSLGISYTGGGLNSSTGLAIDGSGNAWVANQSSNSLTEISSAGTFLSGTNGYTGGGLNQPQGIAIDGSGNVWVTDYASNFVTELSSAGTFLSGTNGYTSAALDSPGGTAIDGSGNAWVGNFDGNSVTEFSSVGTDLSGTNGYTGGALNSPSGIAIDGSGNAWVANYGGNSVTEFSSAGTFLSGNTGYTGGGLDAPFGIAIDGSGDVWVANSGNNSMTGFSSSGTALSGTNGYINDSLNAPFGIAIDGSGNAWITNSGGTSVTEFIGIAAPVITPIVAGLPVTPTTDGTSRLGTRP